MPLQNSNNFLRTFFTDPSYSVLGGSFIVMSPLTIFLALSTLGVDFLLVALFQWVYGEKRRLRRIRSLRQTEGERKNARVRLIQPASAPSPRRSSPSLRVLTSPSREQFAHRRIANASLVPTRLRS
jgi:hypothetical protein